MASQVLSGNGPMSYTNNTGENVRVVINYLGWTEGSGFTNNVVISWGQGFARTTFVSGGIPEGAIGRNLGFISSQSTGSGTINTIGNNAYSTGSNVGDSFALPTEVMLASGSTFSTSMQFSGAGYPQTLAGYNIVVIPEGG